MYKITGNDQAYALKCADAEWDSHESHAYGEDKHLAGIALATIKNAAKTWPGKVPFIVWVRERLQRSLHRARLDFDKTADKAIISAFAHICERCNGSGEGHADGSMCVACHGTGEYRKGGKR